VRRRSFLKQSGLAATLIAGGIPLKHLRSRTVPLPTLPIGPHLREWIEGWRRDAVSYLIEDSHHNWLPPYTQPSRAQGWRLVERIPLDLIPVIEEERVPEENRSLRERFRYGYSVAETHVGWVRVDSMERNLGCVYPKLFLLNHEGEDFGGCGIFHRPFNNVYRDFPSGIRKGRHVFQITGPWYPGERKREAMELRVWEEIKGNT
jgi:hypothetical protein